MSDKKEQGDNPSQKQLTPKEQSRRDFLEASGATVVATAAITGMYTPAASAQSNQLEAEAQPSTRIQLNVNGVDHEIEVQDRWTLNELLRDHLELTGTKIGCNRGECGACTVIMDGKNVYSCSQLAVWADGARITTVEGLAQNGELSPLQQVFVEHNGPQCGFCTPGQLMSATALLASNPRPNAEEVKAGLVGNLCRCSNYNAIVEAVVTTGEQGGTA